VSFAEELQKLTLTLPDYYSSYDSSGNPIGAPVAPTLTGKTVDYGDSTKPVTISYLVAGTSLVREVTIGKTNTTSRSIIGTGIDNFAMSFGQLDSMVNVSLTFATTFRGATSTPNQNTNLTASVSLRNVLRK
jgi:hypothetical protein